MSSQPNNAIKPSPTTKTLFTSLSPSLTFAHRLAGMRVGCKIT
uniref:Uncharacterized protein n=1 Tax=Siphoviridae sp. ctXQ014 TaxID=2825542 RepID=A0A8S5PLX1_9CAUD|nr:MAG TPA: hypothetical protein [Siphoviridae sp. ctXQ014]